MNIRKSATSQSVTPGKSKVLEFIRICREAPALLVGGTALLLHGDTFILDRWLWIKKHLPRTNEGWRLLDVGCGSGALTINSSILGYSSIGISWDERNQKTATARSHKLKASNCKFDIYDVRELDSYPESCFHVIINCENIEHILDDFKLMRDMFSKLNPGGFLLLTTPSYFYKSMSASENGPFSHTEDGWHVRRGYTTEMLRELCEYSGFRIEKISYCSGFFSQKVTWLMSVLTRLLGFPLSWLVTFPLRLLPLLFDSLIRTISPYPDYCICLLAYKPRTCK